MKTSNHPNGKVIEAFETPEGVIEFAQQLSRQNAPQPSKLKLFFGWMAWLLIYGGGTAFGLYLLFQLILNLY